MIGAKPLKKRVKTKKTKKKERKRKIRRSGMNWKIRWPRQLMGSKIRVKPRHHSRKRNLKS